MFNKYLKYKIHYLSDFVLKGEKISLSWKLSSFETNWEKKKIIF